MKRVVVPIIITLLGLWALASLTQFLLHIRRGQQVRQETTRYERPLPSETKILLAGDSVIFGVGSTKPETSIAGLFGRDWPASSITNIGVSGAKTDGLVQQLNSVQGKKYSVVVIIIGANDVVHFANLTKSLQQFDQALMLAREVSSQVVVMPEGNMGNAPIFPRWASLLLTPRSRKFRAGAMPIVQRYGAAYVDVFYERKDDAWRKRPAYYYAGDYFHPADPGCLDWYHAIREGMGRAGFVLPR